MTSYKLPAHLGGGVVEGRPSGDAYVVVAIDGHEIRLPTALVKVVTPLEPGPTARVEVTLAKDQWLVFRRLEVDEPARWYCHDTGKLTNWEGVYGLGEVVHLQPEKVRKGLWGKCSVCAEEKPLRADGKLRQHGSRSTAYACKGSGRPPVSAA